MKKWTRRKFLETGLAGSLVARGALDALPINSDPNQQAEKNAPSPFDSREQELLRVAIDEIIPASDGMPAASAVGGVDYLNRVAKADREIKRDLSHSLAKLADVSRKSFAKPFASLSSAERVRALRTLEEAEPSLFAKLRDYVYEAYYTQPPVWKLIGYEFYPTNGAGPPMKPFDEAALAQVRKKPKFYREVP